MHPRAYHPARPVNGIRTRKITASAATATSRPVPSPETRLLSVLPMVARSWNTSSHTSRPGRNSTPHSSMMPVSLMSRWRRMRVAARQCSTTTCGSLPKDWMSGLRPTPSMRSITAWEYASPKLGRKIFAHLRPSLTVDWCHSLSAFLISSIGVSRYAAEASANVGPCPAPPVRGTCGPKKSSTVIPAPTRRDPALAAFPTSVLRTPVDQVISVSPATDIRRRTAEAARRTGGSPSSPVT